MAGDGVIQRRREVKNHDQLTLSHLGTGIDRRIFAIDAHRFFDSTHRPGGRTRALTQNHLK